MKGGVGTWRREGDYLLAAVMHKSVHKFLRGAAWTRVVREVRLRGKVKELAVFERFVTVIETVEKLGR